MAIVDDTQPEKKEPSRIVQIGALAGLTVVALAIGWGSGLYLSSKAPQAPAAIEPAPAPEEIKLAEEAGALGLVHLEPIMTNLSGPSGMWVRMEAALVFEGKPDAKIAQIVQQDILAYLRTLKAHQVEGASGFQHLKTDLEERASIRSGGRVKQLLIRTLLFE